jgi:predicted ArsR family transcriptional regulator
VDEHDSDAAVSAVAALGDPVRRRLYAFLGAQDHAVGRDEAAEGVGVTRSAAAFHLDRMTEDGLLDVEFRRLTGRQGPGAGRPAKLYRRASQDIAVSLPARRYELAAGLLAAAVEESSDTGGPVAPALDRLARQRGVALAASVSGPPWDGAARALAAVGYEPRTGDGEIVLANCPFHALVADHPALVCRMNLSLLEGFAAALPGAGMTARLRPAPGLCCVRLEAARP